MNILVIPGDHDLENSGDNAMLVVTVRQLKQLIPTLEVSVVTRAPERLKAILPDAKPLMIGASPRMPGRLLELLRKSPSIRNWYRGRRYRSWTNQLLPEIRRTAAVVLSGQGIMTDAFAHEAVWRLELLETAHKLGKAAALFSQGLGVVTNLELSSVMKRVLPQMDLIVLRNRMDADRIRLEFGCQPERIGVGGDDGLAYPPRPMIAGGSSTIGISVRIADYAGLRGHSDAIWVDLARGLQACASALGARLLPVPIEPGDLRAVEEAFGLDPAAGGSLELDGLIRRVAECRLVVTGSYHSAVFSLALGIPAICLVFSDYYAAKFRGLQALYAEGCFLLDLRSSPAQSLPDLVQSVWDRAPALTPAITAISEDLIQRNLAQYHHFADLLTTQT